MLLILQPDFLFDCETAMANAAYSGTRIVTTLATAFDRGTTVGTEAKLGDEYDLRTRADTASQVAIINVLHKHFPRHAFYAEEAWKRGDRIDPNVLTWVIDPVDGTTNYARGQRSYVGICIALMYLGVVVMSLVVDVFGQKSYRAKGKESLCINMSTGEQRPLRTFDAQNVGGKQLLLDIPARHQKIQTVWNFMTRIGLEGTHPPRILGCAALALCEVADGMAMGYVNVVGCYDWDVAAAFPLIQNMGGIVTFLDGTPWSPRGDKYGIIAGATPDVHDTLLRHAQVTIGKDDFDPQIA